MSSINISHQYYLTQMGILTWQERAQASAVSPDWDSLREQVKNCQRCELSQTRQHTVFGAGNIQADLVILGEAPGAEEDQQGEPFIGRAGQLLNEMLLSIGLTRESVFITNILKCHPPNNRDPNQQEVATCTSYLEQQLAMLKPKAILVVGRIAAHSLLGVEESIADMRGKKWQSSLADAPLFVTYHPAYLLHKPSEKRTAYLDLLNIKAFLASRESS